MHKKKKMKHEKKFLSVKVPVFQIVGGVMQPGMYQIGFSTVLPSELPSTLYFKVYNHYDPKAKVKYYMKATLNTVDPKDKMKNK